MKQKMPILIAKYFLVFFWLSLLTKTDSYYSIYIIIGILAVINITKTSKQRLQHTKLEYLFASLFSLMVLLANYSIFSQIAEPKGIYVATAIIAAILVFISGVVVFQQILIMAKTISIKKTKQPTKSPLKFFLICFLIFFSVDLIVLFTCCYPGSLTPDSIDEIGQILSGSYSNHHPFYYTILIYPFIQLGLNVFHNINTGVALFNIFQIIILSATFAYSISTLYRIGLSKKILYPLAIILAILPYNIIYSFTIWKDVLFAASFLILIVSLYRYFHDLAQTKKAKIAQILLIAVSALSVCLFRSNALLAMFVSVFLFFIIFKKKYLKLGILLTIIVVIAFVLKRPVLQLINVRQTDTIESLSIPSQQIASTLKYHLDTIPEEDIKLINHLADVNELADAYSPTIHDPIKNVIRKHGDQNYLKEHTVEFISLYIRLGLHYPIQYLKAWIEQTKGYWNGGYDYWIWANSIQINNYGIERKGDKPLNNLFDSYIESFHIIPFLRPIISIGLIVWILLILLYLAITRKNKINLFLLIPILATWGTLLIATPVFSEFRYIYFAFTTAPFLTIITFIEPSKKTTNKRKGNQ